MMMARKVVEGGHRRRRLKQALAADDSADAKFKILQECGVTIARSPAELGQKIAEVLKK